jgi:hypothetical protein
LQTSKINLNFDQKSDQNRMETEQKGDAAVPSEQNHAEGMVMLCLDSKGPSFPLA